MVRHFSVGSPMLATLRNGLNSWVARLFFLFLVALFVAWGVGPQLLQLVANMTNNTTVATVGGQKIGLPELQQAYQQALSQAERAMGNKASLPAALKQAVGQQTLTNLIVEKALTEKAESLGLTVPAAVVQQTIRAMPAFRGANGQFDQSVFLRVLADNNLSETSFLTLLRQDILHQEMLQPVQAGAFAPAVLAQDVFAFENETRVADMVSLPFSAAPAPAAPSAVDLTRWYENHKYLYQTPEMRHIHAVVLTPAAVEKNVTVSEQDLLGLYDQEKAHFAQPEKRSADVLLAGSESAATKLAAAWAKGETWEAIKAEGSKDGATPITVTAMTREQIPSPELAKALFAAPVGSPPQTVKTPLGWYVFQVTSVVPARMKTLQEATPELRQQVIASKAADLVYERANKIDDLLAGGVPLDKLPADLGLVAVTGTLDAAGLTPAGQPAPIPGNATLRKALIAAAFAAKPGDAPQLLSAKPNSGGSDGYFAVTVDKIIPPAPKPYAEVADQVRKDWIENQIHHEQEKAAAAILTAVEAGTPLATAAAGLTVQRLAPVTRGEVTPGVPPQLVAPLFGLKPGKGTMAETADGFVVAQLVSVHHPDPKQDPIGYQRMQSVLARSIAGDFATLFTEAVRTQAKPKVNDKLLATFFKDE